jgi:hypothetical protein
MIDSIAAHLTYPDGQAATTSIDTSELVILLVSKAIRRMNRCLMIK